MPKQSQRVFIETMSERVKEAKALVLPLIMLELPETPWTAENLRRLYDSRSSFEDAAQRAAELLYDYELPLLEKEEALVAQGLGLEQDLASFEEALFSFERHFWDGKYQDYLGARGEDAPQHDLCSTHRLGKDAVRQVVRAQRLLDPAEVAAHVGADLSCSRCRLGVTRLVIEELRRAKTEGELA